MHEVGYSFPPEWNGPCLPDLVRTMLGDQAIQHGFLPDAYYDVMLCGTHSCGCSERQFAGSNPLFYAGVVNDIGFLTYWSYNI